MNMQIEGSFICFDDIYRRSVLPWVNLP